MSEKIYIVIGESSDYETRSVWNVKAFRGKEEAESLRSKAQKRALEIAIQYTNSYCPDVKGLNEFDPFMIFIGECGANYSVEELELV